MENIDQNTINNIKNIVDNGNINEAISQISPEMIQNFSKMFSQSNNSNNNQNSNSQNNNFESQENKGNQNNNFDFSNIDMASIMKMASTFNKNSNDPRSNLLNSLKPYMRNSRKEKIDNYINLMNMSKIAEMLNNKTNSKNESNKEDT